jgi:hypothetical protein
LVVKCGITNFKERHALITEGSQDGGIDAHFLDAEAKILLLFSLNIGAMKRILIKKPSLVVNL